MDDEQNDEWSTGWWIMNVFFFGSTSHNIRNSTPCSLIHECILAIENHQTWSDDICEL